MEEIAPIIRVTAPRRQFKDHENSVFAVAVFPDGHRMITGSGDQTLVLWDLQDGVSLKKMKGHRSQVQAVAVSKDGKLIASGGDDGKLIVWLGDTGESLIQVAEVHPRPIYSLDFSPDGAVLASGSFDTTTELWSTETWQVQGNPINCCGNIYCVRYSPSGEHLAISTYHDIQIWNPCTRECIAKFNAAINEAINISLAWAPNGTRLFSVGSRLDPTIREWDTSSWKQIGEPWTGHADNINTVLVNPNTTFIASVSDDCQVRLWRLSDRRTIVILKDTSKVYCASFSADGTRILSGGKSSVFKEWSVPEEALILLEDTPKGETQDSDLKATLPAESLLRLRSAPSTSITTAKLVQVIPRISQPRRAFKGHKRTVFAVALLDGHRMVTSSADQTLILWSLKDGVVLKKMEGHKNDVMALAVSRDGKLIASGDDNGALIAWDGVTGESLTQAITVHSSLIHSVDFSRDGTALASGSFDTTTEIWCTKTWQVSGYPIPCHGRVFCVRYSPSGEFLAIAGKDILIYNTRTMGTMECIATLQTLAHSLTWTLDGTRLFSGGNDSDPNIREWDTLTWKQVGDHWSGHTNRVYAVAINPAGTLVASACGDTHVRLWRSSDRRTIAIFKNTGQPCCVTFSADGKYILSGGGTMIKEWAVPEDALLEAT
ncbi:WD40 repeat-like protein, partial [Rhizopogon salebrosus TDB-379]